MQLIFVSFIIFISAISQCWSIPSSFLSLSVSSARLYFSLRLGRFNEVNPPIKNLLFVMPLVVVQIIGPLFSLIVLAAYFKVKLFMFSNAKAKARSFIIIYKFQLKTDSVIAP
jgi:hypothetical protein